MPNIREEYDVVVVGAGHAGCEAALASARLGLNTICFTVSCESIAMMPCNPNIGGSSKGHLVREIDALGGEMGKNIDATFIQSKMLNKSKGPAVHSLRAQADKADYSRRMRQVMENTDNLLVRQAEVSELMVEDGVIKGVKTFSGAEYYAKAVVLCTGVYLKARCIYGDTSYETGPNGLQAATHLTDSLIKNGIEVRRFKTGTPARVDKRSVDFSKMTEQFGDERVVPFSFTTDPETIQKEQVSCWLTYTNEKTHKIIRDNLDRSPLYAGVIHSTGPRYCPSIEDKVVKFADKERHQIFLEPESKEMNTIYVQGFSTSMPHDIQEKMVHSLPGLENCTILKYAYAIEYDAIDPLQLWPSLETKVLKNLFTAGQINGTSGYEEAAGQGLIAGINASKKVKGDKPLILKRDEAYIGVLIDDLVTKGTKEPYRMLTSRAEYRLLLRHDNADERLRKYGHDAGLVNDEVYSLYLDKMNRIHAEIERLDTIHFSPKSEINDLLEEKGSTRLKEGVTARAILQRPELVYEDLLPYIEHVDLTEEEMRRVTILIKYKGYIEKTLRQVEKVKNMEEKQIPADLDYDDVLNLSLEARQKLKKVRPVTIGQATRISGINPADISVLLIHLKTQYGD